MMPVSLLAQMVNEIQTVEDYHTACTMIRHNIRAGRGVDSSVVFSLATKGHQVLNRLTPNSISAGFLMVLNTEPTRVTMEDNA